MIFLVVLLISPRQVLKQGSGHGGVEIGGDWWTMIVGGIGGRAMVRATPQPQHLFSYRLQKGFVQTHSLKGHQGRGQLVTQSPGGRVVGACRVRTPLPGNGRHQFLDLGGRGNGTFAFASVTGGSGQGRCRCWWHGCVDGWMDRWIDR